VRVDLIEVVLHIPRAVLVVQETMQTG
jgi:hypothetical protein